MKAPAKKKIPPKIMLPSKLCGPLLLLIFWAEIKNCHKGAEGEEQPADEIENPTGDAFKNGDNAQGNKNEENAQCHVGKTGKTEDEAAFVFGRVIHEDILQ